MDKLSYQIENNRETASNTFWFTGHREKVHDLISSKITGSRNKIMILGAGNSNDVDLSLLAQKVEEIHLVDIDKEALLRAYDNCTIEVKKKIFLHPNIDLSVRENSSHLPDNMDIVVSTCLLSQMIDSMYRDKSEELPLEQILSLRRQHFKIMVDCLRPGGYGIFITDIVSSQTYPELDETPEFELRELLDKLIANRNFFTGLNPTAVMKMLYSHDVFLDKIDEIHFENPWLWHMSEDRSFLVYAISFRRK